MCAFERSKEGVKFKMQNIDFKIKIGFVVMLIILISTIGLYIYKTRKEDDDEYMYYENEIIENEASKHENNSESTITIHITGEVKYPGVVVLKEGARIVDAIEAAGGEKDEADLNKLNLAYILNDGEKIYVPNKNDNNAVGDYITVDTEENISSTNDKKESLIVNINTATLEELVKIPGVGEATANKIIAYRKENGKFKEPEDIKNVPGIGNSKYENIKDMIKVK